MIYLYFVKYISVSIGKTIYRANQVETEAEIRRKEVNELYYLQTAITTTRTHTRAYKTVRRICVIWYNR